MTEATAVFFISFGGPEKSDDIMPFLEIVTQGRNIPRERLLDVAHHYELIGGASPINAITARQADGLRTALAATGTPLPVYQGNRNWHPFIEDGLRRMAADGIRKAVGFITAAHRTEASLERYVRAVEIARQVVGAAAPEIEYVGPWFDHPLFIDAICKRIREAFSRFAGLAGLASHGLLPTGLNWLNTVDVEWIFTAHSVPCSMAKESTYVIELQRTAELVCEKLHRKQWSLAYSSRSGSPQDAWLEPDVCDAIRQAAARGIKEVLIIPIGFVADHVEVLFDLDIEAQEAAKEAGVRMHRAATTGEHPLFIEMIREVVRARLKESAGEFATSSERTRRRDGVVQQKPGRTSTFCYCQPGAENPPCQRAPVARPALRS